MQIASLVVVRALNQQVAETAHDNEGAADARFGFTLTESAKRLGIQFTHQVPTFDSRLEHIMPHVASTGAAISIVDFYRDGWPDVYVANSGEGSLNHLYRNKGDGTFVD